MRSQSNNNLVKNINNNLQPKTTITSKNKFPDGESVEQQLTIIPRLTNKRRGSIADHAFPELHQKVVEIKKITCDEERCNGQKCEAHIAECTYVRRTSFSFLSMKGCTLITALSMSVP